MRKIDTMYDVQQLLKRYGIFIYTGNRNADIDLMEAEIRDLYQANLISIQSLQKALFILRKEKT